MPNNDWSTPLGGQSGDWLMLGYTKLSGAATTYDFPVTLADALYTGYRVTIHYVNGYAGVSRPILRINGASAQGYNQLLTANNTAITASRFTNVLYVADTPQSLYGSYDYHIENSIASISGRRSFSFCSTGTSSILLYMMTSDITTPASTTEITSLGVGSTQTDGLGVNSILRLYGRVA